MKQLPYKLCEQLKEAGFPQDFKVGDWYRLEKGDRYLLYYKEPVMHRFAPSGMGTASGSVARINAIKDEMEIVKIPTLEELIDACGDELIKLQRAKTEEGKGWIAYTDVGIVLEGKFGETPKIAVAKLYIELKKL